MHLGDAERGRSTRRRTAACRARTPRSRALELADAADHDDQEGVDDVVGAHRRADRAEQGQRDPGDAGQAGADEEGQPVDPAGRDAGDRGEVPVLHHGPDPPAQRGELQDGVSADDASDARPRMNSRLLAMRQIAAERRCRR